MQSDAMPRMCTYTFLGDALELAAGRTFRVFGARHTHRRVAARHSCEKKKTKQNILGVKETTYVSTENHKQTHTPALPEERERERERERENESLIPNKPATHTLTYLTH